MKYMGSKSRHAKELLPIILKNRDNRPYVEPFVGGCNMIDKVEGGIRYGNDSNWRLIEMFKALQNGWIPPSEVSEDLYNEVRANENEYPAELVAFVAIACSYGAKWWGGYARGKSSKGEWRNYAAESQRNLLKQLPNLKGVEFSSVDYSEMIMWGDSVVYCDPPYANSTKYKSDFDHDKFWAWCDQLVSNNIEVYVSEYSAPEHWKCVWEKDVNAYLVRDTEYKRNTERLFVHESRA